MYVTMISGKVGVMKPTVSYACHTMSQWQPKPHQSLEMQKSLQKWPLSGDLSQKMALVFNGKKSSRSSNRTFDRDPWKYIGGFPKMVGLPNNP